jgi:hypothetical protein
MSDAFYSNLHCCAAYHISQLTGDGSTQAFYLYDRCCALGHESGKAFPSLRQMALFLHCHETKLYAAAGLLVDEGWLVEEFKKPGTPTHYVPVEHDVWVGRHPGRCAQRLEPDYWKRDPLGAAFYGITGGCKIPGPNILTGWLRLCDGNKTLLLEHAKAYVTANPLPRHLNKHPEWRAGFGSFLEQQP